MLAAAQDGTKFFIPKTWHAERTGLIAGSRWAGYRVVTLVDPLGDRFCSTTARARLLDEKALIARNGGELLDDNNRSFCEVCAGAGDVVCCDGCPAVFHAACIRLEYPDLPIPAACREECGRHLIDI